MLWHKTAPTCYCKHQQSCTDSCSLTRPPHPGKCAHSSDIHTGPRQQQWKTGPEVLSQVLSLAGINVECSKSATKFSQKESDFLCLYGISSKCVAGETHVHKEQQRGTGSMSPVFPCLLCSWGIMDFKPYKTTPNKLREVAFNAQRPF